MTIKDINVEIYHHKIKLIEVNKKDKYSKLEEILYQYNLPSDTLNDIKYNIENKCINGGWTISSMSRRLSLVIILPCSNKESRRDVINHEKRHIEDDILEHCGVNDKEASAYLAGYLSKYMY